MARNNDDDSSVLSRRRPGKADEVKHEDPSELNELLTFDGKKYLGRSRRPDNNDENTTLLTGFLAVCLVLCLFLLYACYFHFPIFHFHLSHVYAKLGHAQAQHIVGERLLHGEGVAKDEVLAMEWFRKAADQGHPHAAYNLAIGHLNGLPTDVGPGEAHDLIKHAHDNGVEEAADVYHNACLNGQCD